jgi:hypothetical protein
MDLGEVHRSSSSLPARGQTTAGVQVLQDNVSGLSGVNLLDE